MFEGEITVVRCEAEYTICFIKLFVMFISMIWELKNEVIITIARRICFTRMIWELLLSNCTIVKIEAEYNANCVILGNKFINNRTRQSRVRFVL